MKKVLLATDFSRRSDLALRRARLIARGAGAALTLAHVVDADQPPPLVSSHATAAEAALAAQCADDGQTATRPLVLRGDVFWALRQAAMDEGAELIVAGEHRRSWLRDAFRDTTVERLARVTPVPLLVARNPDPAPYGRAVIGVESDEGAMLAAVLAKLGEAAPATAMIIHAFDAVAAGTLATAGVSRDEVAAYRSEIAERGRQAIACSLPKTWRDVPLEVVGGDAIDVLQEAVRRLGADLLVASTHARRGLDRLILGSVSAHFIRQGSTDFLLVPPARTD